MSPTLRRSGFSLDIQDAPKRQGIVWAEVAEALRRLHPEWPAFVVLSHPNGDYIQVAGGKEALTVEVRRYKARSGYMHYRLGNGPVMDGKVRRDCVVGPIFVRSDERLSFADAFRAFDEFFRTGEPPGEYRARPLDDAYR